MHRRRESAALPLLLALALLGACEPAANLEGKACPCVGGYVCCLPENICLRPEQVCVGAGRWPVATQPGTPQPLDAVTVYAFSQVNTDADGEGNVDDPQLARLKPDLVIRGWAQWGIYGGRARDYEFSYVDRCHTQDIRFMGGLTATALLENELEPDRASTDWDLTSRNAENEPVLRIDADDNHIYRGSLANPDFRNRLINIAKLQIDGERSVAGVQLHEGVDGLHFQEVNAGYQGANAQRIADGNEGFDRFHLADFNAYLLAKNPPGTDFGVLYGMTADNLLRPDVPAGDLTRNFNYWDYLSRNGWSTTPLAEGNPLAKEWGRATVNRPLPGALTFVDSAEPYRYWKQIATAVRDYARDKYGRPILITAQGIYPFVDFQSVGLSEENADGPGGTPVHYLPLTAEGQLDGTQSLQVPFLHLKAMAEQFAPGAPVVLFLDGLWKAYEDFPEDGTDRQDFWRLYAAEAYANGLFFAFHLKSLLGETVVTRTATALGLMPLFESLATFYRAHADYYHGGRSFSAAAVKTPLPNTMIAVRDHFDASDLSTPVRRLVHLVNHAYRPGIGITPQHQVVVRIASERMPVRVSLASPDLDDVLDLSSSHASGQVEVMVPRLDAYAVIALWY